MSDLDRFVCEDWQAGRMRWTDAVASLGLSGLPQLYAVAYRSGVEVRRRFADEMRLPHLARWHDLSPKIWKANPSWQPVWFANHERWARTTEGYSGGPGYAMRIADGLERGTRWLFLQQMSLHYINWEAERMEKETVEERERHARLVIQKGLDRTFPHPELTPSDFVSAWLDGDLPIAELPSRMRLTQAQADRLRRAAMQAALQAHRRILAGREMRALIEFGRTTDDLTETVVRAWYKGEISETAACELIGTGRTGLRWFAERLGIEVRRDEG